MIKRCYEREHIREQYVWRGIRTLSEFCYKTANDGGLERTGEREDSICRAFGEIARAQRSSAASRGKLNEHIHSAQYANDARNEIIVS